MSLSPQELFRLLQLVDFTVDEEIDCDTFLHRVVGYLERLGQQGALPEGYEDVAQHLKVCPECSEEFEAMFEEYRRSSSSD